MTFLHVQSKVQVKERVLYKILFPNLIFIIKLHILFRNDRNTFRLIHNIHTLRNREERTVASDLKVKEEFLFTSGILHLKYVS